MKAIIKIYNSAMAWFGGIARDKLLHLLAGVLIAAFFALVIPHTAGWCIVFAIFTGMAKRASTNTVITAGIGSISPIRYSEV